MWRNKIPHSWLNLYRIALKVRAELLKPLGDTSLTWVPAIPTR